MNPEDFKSAGVYPTGPVSLWPKDRQDEAFRKMAGAPKGAKIEITTETEGGPIYAPPRPSAAKMAKGLLSSGAQAIRRGRVSKDIREERMATCEKCPLYDPKNKRCRDCGCFMEAKSWIGGDPNNLCPQQKWKQ